MQLRAMDEVRNERVDGELHGHVHVLDGPANQRVASGVCDAEMESRVSRPEQSSVPALFHLRVRLLELSQMFVRSKFGREPCGPALKREAEFDDLLQLDKPSTHERGEAFFGPAAVEHDDST